MELPSDDGARVEQVADGVYVILHDDATDEWPHGNTGVVVGKRGVFVLDSDYLPSRARADIALIRQLTDEPVRWLATTHWHFDHNNGAIAYREAFPDVQLISERQTAGWIEINQQYWSRMSTAPDSNRRASIATLESESKDPDLIARRTAELAELEALEVLTPDHLFDDVLRIPIGGQTVELRSWGPANSPDDVTMFLPRSKVLFTGDIVVQYPLPFVGGSWPVPWVGVLDGLDAIDTTRVVPGHGPVMDDHTYIRQLRTFFGAVVDRVEAEARKGRTLDQIQAELVLDDLLDAVPAWAEVDKQGEDWAYTRTTLIERAWKNVRGQG